MRFPKEKLIHLLSFKDVSLFKTPKRAVRLKTNEQILGIRFNTFSNESLIILTLFHMLSIF
jgi:hypothetical protein